MHTPMTWDIFCRVVDNFGDAGVCWRLARQLATEHGAQVRLWIDDLVTLQRLQPAISGQAARQDVEGVCILLWESRPVVAAPARVVVEAFGCGLPVDYLASMRTSHHPPLWIVLEYLSAEAWVAEYHGLPSPHPRWPLARYFFFPGFREGTGGLLREANLLKQRDRFSRADREALWHRLGHPIPENDAVIVSLFTYESAPIRDFLQCWERGATPTIIAVAESEALQVVARYFGSANLPAGTTVRQGALELRVIPFVPQAAYDMLLWSCDLNFVRGEDSLVRAQWAVRPFVWHAYPQQDLAHVGKLEAFIALYTELLPKPERDAVSNLMRLWNRVEVPGVTPAMAWHAYLAALRTLNEHGIAWAQTLAGIGELAANLARFCRDKIK